MGYGTSSALKRGRRPLPEGYFASTTLTLRSCAGALLESNAVENVVLALHKVENLVCKFHMRNVSRNRAHRAGCVFTCHKKKCACEYCSLAHIDVPIGAHHYLVEKYSDHGVQKASATWAATACTAIPCSVAGRPRAYLEDKVDLSCTPRRL